MIYSPWRGAALHQFLVAYLAKFNCTSSAQAYAPMLCYWGYNRKRHLGITKIGSQRKKSVGDNAAFENALEAFRNAISDRLLAFFKAGTEVNVATLQRLVDAADTFEKEVFVAYHLSKAVGVLRDYENSLNGDARKEKDNAARISRELAGEISQHLELSRTALIQGLATGPSTFEEIGSTASMFQEYIVDPNANHLKPSPTADQIVGLILKVANAAAGGQTINPPS